jgi:hypothetical protein
MIGTGSRVGAWRRTALGVVVVAVTSLALAGCFDDPGPSTPPSSTTSSSTTVPDEGIEVTAACRPTTVAPGEDGAATFEFADLTDEQRGYVAERIAVDVRWSGPANTELALALSDGDDGFAGLTVDGPGSGGDVSFRDDAEVPAVELPSADDRGMVGAGRPDQPLAGMAGVPLGDGWMVAAINFDETVTAQIESCELTVTAVPSTDEEGDEG